MELKVNYSIVYPPFCFLLILAHATDTTNTPTGQHLIIPQYKKQRAIPKLHRAE